ncbi:MAG: transketolase family protein [Caecibacter massiliensis]|uniref:transketolase family protein n=1 Tax=Megasphaera sp. UBA4382 TaxID=1946850 RepID=UPI0025C4B260|nr:transketolase C-terminal domain-containing protein [Megasphaera sp. UBA4382]MCI5531607.1 transketolase family protein [Caecibacter massiliensis]
MAMSTRDAYGHVLETEIYKNPDVVVVDADIASSTRAEKFKNKAPERFFNVGISEQDLMGTAAGLAAVGKIPLAGSYALFTERGLEITRNSICLPNLNVKIIVSHGGLTIGSDGATHQAIEDIALMRSLPNLSVIVPSDGWETEEAVKAAVAHKGPVYIRLGKDTVPDIHPAGSTFQWGKGQILRDGIDVALIGTGRMTAAALAAADQLRQEGLEAMVINMPTIKPIDADLIEYAARKTGHMVTAEEGTVLGGLGSAVAETLVRRYPVRQEFIGVQDTFGESGSSEDLLKKYGLTADDIAAAARKVLA